MRDDLERTRPFLAALVGLHRQDALITQMEPELRAENTLIAIKSLFKAESLRQPLIIWLEDAHWLDADSRAFLARLTRNVEAYPLLLLVTSRIEPAADWFEAAAPQQVIHLRPLDKANILTLAQSLLGAQSAATTTQLLAERADGNPYFAEQMALYLREQPPVTRMGQEKRALPQSPEAMTPLPADIRTVLTARLDRLAPEMKRVVQRAAVLGREFDPQVLAQMLPNRLTVGGQLEKGVREAIWFPVGDGRYLFKHALLRDAAYEMQLHSSLRLLHREAAQAYEAVLQTTPNYGQIAYHYDKGEVVVKALDYYEKAADQAKANYQNEAALAHYGRALQLAPVGEYDRRFRLLLNREEIYQWLGSREEQQQDLKQLSEIVTEQADNRQAEVALRQAAFALVTGDYELAQAKANRAVNLAVEAGDPLTEMRAYGRLGRILWQQGRPQDAEPILDQALRLARNHAGQLEEAQCLYDLGITRQYQGDLEDARRYALQAQGVYAQLGHRQGEIRCLNLIGLVYHALGEFSASEGYYKAALELSRAIGWRYAETAILVNLGNNFFDLGCYDISEGYHKQVLLISRETGNREMESVGLDTLGLIAHGQGHYAAARHYFEQALAIGRSINNERSIGYALTHLGYTLVELAELDNATATLEQALALRRGLGNEAGVIDALGGLALTAAVNNALDEALEYVESILAWIKENGTDGLEFPVQLYLLCYRVLQAAAGQSPAYQRAAQTVLANGYALLQKRAAHIQDDDLRQHYLERVSFNREIQTAFGLPL